MYVQERRGKMAKYEHEAKVVLEAVGGKENIQSLTHCMTRLRLVLNDASKVDKTQIAALTAIKGTAFQSGQFQIIIGNDVKAFYETLQDLLGERRVSNQSALKDQLMRSIGDVFAPLIPAIISGGLMLGLEDLVGAQLGTLFHLLGTTIFTYLPVGIVYGVVQKLGGTPILGIVLGLVLCLEEIGYAGSVMVAILAGLALGLIEKGLRHICPNSISMLLVPLLSLVISCALVLAGLGPLGSWLDSTLSRGLYLLLISPAGLLVSFVLGVGYVCLVMTGMHHLTLPLDLIFISGYGYTMLWPLLALCNIAQASSALGMYVLQYKDARIRKQNREACISCYMGVSEPALFGINQKYRYPLYAGMIGSGVACLLANGWQVKALSVGIGGLAGIFSIEVVDWLHYLICMAVAIVLPVMLTFVRGRTKQSKREVFLSPAEGIIHPLSEVPDTVFASGMMGEGLAIELVGDTIYAPMSGEVSMIFPTKHAYGLKLSDGSEILIHIGLDTVALNGQGFDCRVEAGQTVRQGDILCIIDRAYILNQGKSLMTPIVWTDHQTIMLVRTGRVQAQEKGLVQKVDRS